jgi:hypothetical protein
LFDSTYIFKKKKKKTHFEREYSKKLNSIDEEDIRQRNSRSVCAQEKKEVQQGSTTRKGTTTEPIDLPAMTSISLLYK